VRFLIDESCDFNVARVLRADGHDVVAIVEQSPGLTDRDVLILALREERLLITEDKDFGQLAFSALAASGGVLFIRYPTTAREHLPSVVARFVATDGHRLSGAFVTLSPGRIRIGHLPSPPD